jgi:serine/threonine-protein kinase
MRRFLSFTVEQRLQNRAEELKEYLIGLEVFDKKPDYDPRLDPIVRVEARRLRAKLKEYYEGEGKNDDLVVEFQKGSYVPQFHWRERMPEPTRVDARAGAMAVLPFANLGASPDHAYFADGLTEELIHGLTRIQGLRVVAWNSAAQLRDRQQDLAAIREQLNVGAVLTGSVRRAGNRVRVSVQLIDTASGVYLWSDTYDREREDVFLMQEEISRAVVGALRMELGRRSQTAPRPIRNVEAHNLCLQGRYHWNKRSPEGLLRSVRLFEQAVAIDPEFALGHAGLADSLSLLSDYGLARPSEIVPRAKASALRALELDPQLGEAWASVALIRASNDWEWDEAARDFERALEYTPGYATAHFWYSVDYLAMLGRFDEAMAEIDLARQLDPLSAIITEGAAYVRLLRRDYAASLRIHHEALELDPFFYKGFAGIGRTYIQQERHHEAVEMLQRARELAGDVPGVLGALGQAQALAGNREEACRLLEQLSAMAQQRYVPSVCFAIIHLGLGDNSAALDWLERGCQEREVSLKGINVHPLYDPLRREPRFHALLRQTRLA